MTQALTAHRSKKLIAFRDDQVAALAAIAEDTHSNFTATVLDAVDAYIATHDKTAQQMIDRVVTENAGLLERLRDA
jgi:ABC-type Fe3+-hydroxamate transport system substrate-binding protein